MANFTHILRNLKNFATKNTMVFFLFIICSVADVLCILFAHGVFQNYQKAKEYEESKLDLIGYSFAFGEIVEENEIDDGRVVYVGSESISLSDFYNLLDHLDEETKSNLPGFYSWLVVPDELVDYNDYFLPDDDGEIPSPMIDIQIEYYDEINDYAYFSDMYESISLETGRYFTMEEYASEEKLVVMPQCTKPEYLGKEVTICGETYKVIGIFNEPAFYLDMPYKMMNGNLRIYDMTFTYDKPLDSATFAKFRQACEEYLPVNVLFPPIDTVDLNEIEFYNSIMFISVAVAVASAINLAMLFRYVIRSRRRQTAIMILCGCTGNRIRLMYIIEISLIAIIIYALFAAVFHFALLPLLVPFFEFIRPAYSMNVYLKIFAIYYVFIYLFLNLVIVRSNSISPVQMLKERGK